VDRRRLALAHRGRISVLPITLVVVTGCSDASPTASPITTIPDAAAVSDAIAPEPVADASPMGSDADVGLVHAGACRDPLLLSAGSYTKIYDPSVGETSAWYINDHTFVRGRDGTWHLFGITHQEPANPADEKSLAHATASSLVQTPWQKQAPALVADPNYGESVLWAPYVLDNTANDGMYYMFYCGGSLLGHDQYQIEVATSTDLWTWTRNPTPLFTDGYDARDPYVLRVGNTWVLYYTATSAPAGGNHIVAYRTSTDLRTWGQRQVAYVDPSVGTAAGPTESPFVAPIGGSYYLFVGPRPEYVGTDIFRSDDPLHFEYANKVGHVQSHAAEVVQDVDGSWHVSAAGWAQGGVYLAPLIRTPTSCETVEKPSYRVAVQVSPFAALSSLAVDPAGSGSYRELLATSQRGTVPYLGVGAFGDTRRPGAPAGVDVAADGRSLTVRGIPFGAEPVTADWTFCFGDQSFDHELRWHVASSPSAPVYEVAWAFENALRAVGDDTNTSRSGDVPGFPAFSLASDDRLTLIAAYRNGSAWRTDNRFFFPAQTDVVPGVALAWQPLWAANGTSWGTGSYPGGAWRIGASAHTADTAYGAQLAAGINQDRPCGP
jgi:hypothetical protein